MRANNVIAEIGDFNSGYCQLLGSRTHEFFRLGVCSVILADASDQFSTVKQIQDRLDAIVDSGVELRAYIDVIGRLAGFVSFQFTDHSTIQIHLFRSFHGAALSLARSLARSLDVSEKEILCTGKRFPSNRCHRLSNRSCQKESRQNIFDRYWGCGEGIDCLSAAKDLIHQYSLLGFALHLSLKRQNFSHLPFKLFYRLVSHPAALRQMEVIFNSYAQPEGLSAWALLHESTAMNSSIDLVSFQDISAWRSGLLQVPVWRL